jgi:hypothetical protein
MRNEVEKITQERVLEMLVNGNQVPSAWYVAELRAIANRLTAHSLNKK